MTEAQPSLDSEDPQILCRWCCGIWNFPLHFCIPYSYLSLLDNYSSLLEWQVPTVPWHVEVIILSAPWDKQLFKLRSQETLGFDCLLTIESKGRREWIAFPRKRRKWNSQKFPGQRLWCLVRCLIADVFSTSVSFHFIRSRGQLSGQLFSISPNPFQKKVTQKAMRGCSLKYRLCERKPIGKFLCFCKIKLAVIRYSRNRFFFFFSDRTTVQSTLFLPPTLYWRQPNTNPRRVNINTPGFQACLRTDFWDM